MNALYLAISHSQIIEVLTNSKIKITKQQLCSRKMPKFGLVKKKRYIFVLQIVVIYTGGSRGGI